MKHIVPVILSLCLLTACVDKSYDLSVLDGEMNIFPGIELDIPQVMTYKAEDIFGLSQNPSVKIDEYGYYNLVSDRQVLLNDSYPDQRIEEGIDLGYHIIVPFSADVPEIFRKDAPKLDVPRINLSADFENPCPYSVTVSFMVQVENSQKAVSFVAPPQSSKSYKDVINSRFKTVPASLTIQNMHIRKSDGQAASQSSQAYTFHMSFGTSIPLEVSPGSQMQLESDINPLSSAIVLDTKKAEVDITVRNYLGLALDIESYNPVVPDFTLSFDHISSATGIAPGRIVAECGSGLRAAKDSVSTIMVLRNDTDRSVKITKDSYLSITAKSVIFPEGFYFE